MNPLAKRSLGRCGVTLPALGMGGAPLGELFVKIDERTSEATIGAAWDAGIRFFDTAPWYGRGQSEIRMGRGLYRHPRDEFVLSTKIGRVLRRPHGTFKGGFWTGGLPFEHDWDYSYDGVMRSFEDSLQRLGMNRIDLLLIHDLDFQHHQTEPKVNAYLSQLATGGARALEELRAAGVIRGFGAGINEMGMIPRLLDLVDLDFFLVALPYTLMDQDPLDSEFPRCQERDVGIIIGAVFCGGILATGPIPGAKYRYRDADAAALSKAGRIEAVCARHGVPLAAAALQFPFGHPSIAAVIPGAFDPAQIQQNVANFRHEIPSALWAELKEEGLIRPDAPTP